jgi:hypothetical protein
MAIAVSVVAAGVSLGSAVAWRNRHEDLRPLPAMLAAYTLHGGTHILIALALRAYVPGLATVPLVILPYSWWAWTQLRYANVPLPWRRLWRDAARGGFVATGLAVGGHVVADVLVSAAGKARGAAWPSRRR